MFLSYVFYNTEWFTEKSCEVKLGPLLLMFIVKGVEANLDEHHVFSETQVKNVLGNMTPPRMKKIEPPKVFLSGLQNSCMPSVGVWRYVALVTVAIVTVKPHPTLAPQQVMMYISIYSN